MHRGYIKLWRKIRDSFVWQDADCLKLFIHLIMEANHKDTEFLFNGKKTILKRGQLICGRKSLEAELKINESKIFRLLKLLKNEHLIEQQTFNLYSIVSIVSYDEYNTLEQQNEQPVNNQRTTSEQPVNTSKELIRTNKNYNIGADAPLFLGEDLAPSQPAGSKPPAVKRGDTPQGRIMTGFKEQYQLLNGAPYVDSAADYAILAGLIKACGEDLVIKKLNAFGKGSVDGSLWFVKDTFTLTIKKFKQHFNDIPIEKSEVEV